jgi:transmembrane sensor
MNKDILIRYFSREISPEEEKAFFEWIDKDPENKKAFEEAGSVWKITGSLNDFHSWDTDQSWKRLKTQIIFEGAGDSRRPQFLWLKVAASVALLITIGFLVRNFTTQYQGKIMQMAAEEPNGRIEMMEFSTRNDMHILHLPDSSIVWLNKNSKIKYPHQFDEKERVVYMEGEAFFEITKRPDQPFTIYSGQTKTKVLGTSFNLRSYPSEDKTKLSVVTGKVEFSYKNEKSGNSTIVLEPNETGVFDKNNYLISKVNNKGNSGFLAWKANKNEIKKTSLYQKEISEPFDVFLHSSQDKTRQNIMKRTIVEGNIYNTSILRTFKNIIMHVDYYNKAGEKVGEGYFTVKETIFPGHSIKYKEKLEDWFTPATRVVITVADAQTVNE